MQSDAVRFLWLGACAAVPGLFAIVATAGMLLLAVGGHHPMWPHGDLTLSEAAALRDAGEVALLISRGADPNRPAPIRRRMLLDRTVTLTPIAAAARAQRAEIVLLLLRHGAAPDDAAWTRLACEARRSGATDVVQALMAWRPGVTPACDRP